MLKSNCFDIAVLICVYKKDDPFHLKQALDSVFFQNNMDLYKIKLYIHVDGEIDNALNEIILNSNYYRIIRSNNNIGLAKGLNKLINELENEKYVFRMDADDICDKERFWKQILFMENNPEIDFSGGSMSEFIGDMDNVVNKRVYPLLKNDIINFMIKGSPFSHVTVCFRRSSFEKIGYYPDSFPLNEDIALWDQAVRRNCNFANIKDNLIYVRMDNAYSRRTFIKAINEFKVYFKISMRMKKLPVFPLLRLFFRLLPTSLVAYFYNSPLRYKVLR
ncbi:glycosyltransferase [Photobacterium damselae]|uniref:glycosyltransferase n=1 Tax=Photobacterium damselae TaxID=38293 RepID=UPI0030F41D1A